ncbi:hypothetical protein FACS1894122_06540 [Alphaproteobacteria bacterium]|nr:hypothetical protein FACS1894122_06540 [Alphaproteobacteria bacterium]
MQTEKEFDLLPPCNDFVFKNVFGKASHKRALISLLNAILDGNPVIRDITIENSEIPRDFSRGRSIHLDISATSDDSTKLNIEMQCFDAGRIINRSAFHRARRMSAKLKKSEEFDALPNMISIWLANYDETKRNYHTHEALYMFKKTPFDPAEIATDKFRTFIIELPKVDIKQTSIADMFKVWVYFLRNPEKIPAEFLTIPEVEEAMNELRYVSQDSKVRRKYEEYLKWQNDEINARSHARNEGIAIGEERGLTKGMMEGRKEGRMEGKRETALTMLSDDMSIASISKYTGLSLSEIESLKQ